MRGGFAIALIFNLFRIYPSSVGFADSFPPRGKHWACIPPTLKLSDRKSDPAPTFAGAGSKSLFAFRSAHPSRMLSAPSISMGVEK